MGRSIRIAAALIASGPSWVVAQTTFEFAGHAWSTSSDVKIEDHLGREALLMRSGSVVLEGVTFENGVIEYEMSTTGIRSFAGVHMRVRDDVRGHEEFYLRPHQTGRFDAVQYTPNFGGLTAWQLYPEHNAPALIPSAEWVPVRLVVSGPRLAAYVGDGESPVLVVDRLRRGPGSGRIRLFSNFPGGQPSELYPTAFSNFRVTVSDERPPWPATDPPQQGVVTTWEMSPSLPAVRGALETLDPALLNGPGWEVVETEPNGRLNIAAHRRFPSGESQGMVLTRVVIHSTRAQTKTLNFGFSDRGSVFLNGRFLLSSNNTYRSRSLRYLGVMTVENDAVSLPLKEGDNELVFAVSESFGGWGLVARLADLEGVQFRYPGNVRNPL